MLLKIVSSSSASTLALKAILLIGNVLEVALISFFTLAILGEVLANLIALTSSSSALAKGDSGLHFSNNIIIAYIYVSRVLRRP